MDAVVESYQTPWPINNLASAGLPSRRHVVEALREIEPILFMGFYATNPLEGDALRLGIAGHMQRAFTLLVEQVERALVYQEWLGNCPKCPQPGSGERLTLSLFDKLPELRRKLNLDVQAAYHGDPAAQSLEEVVFSYPSIAAIGVYRLAHELWRMRVPLLPRILTETAHSETGIDIHPGARIGESFFIDHGTGVVIGATSVLRDHVKLYQGVTLGALSIPDRGETSHVQRHPTLENHVTVYSGATILGGKTVIGNHSVVGGNVWLVESVPPNSKVFGRPRTID